MIKNIIACVGLAMIVMLTLIGDADARSKSHRSHDRSNDSEIIREMEKLRQEILSFKKLLQQPKVASIDENVPLPRRNPIAIAPMPIPDPEKTVIAKSKGLKNLVGPLADKVAEILLACHGTKLASGYRPGARVAGSGRPSLHGTYPAKAADLAGNPQCIKEHMAGWPGGMSTDYLTAPGGKHYHISYDKHGREWGARFAHRGGGRYARHHRHRHYAMLHPSRHDP